MTGLLCDTGGHITAGSQGGGPPGSRVSQDRGVLGRAPLWVPHLQSPPATGVRSCVRSRCSLWSSTVCRPSRCRGGANGAEG